MQADEQYKRKLIERYVAGEASEKELQAFFGLLTEAEIDILIDEHMDQEIFHIREEQHLIKPVKRFRPLKYAAVVIGVFFVSYILHFNTHIKQTERVAKNQIHDIAPGSNRATLTLAGGQKIILTPMLRGFLANQGNIQIQAKSGNGITYISAGKPASEIEYNMLSTLRGEQSPYPLILSDGTKVWLNSASSIKFPTAFTGLNRTVTLTGEAYFEVAHNAAKPFDVIAEGQTVEVLGTHFNVNAYKDEPSISTTLLEGKVKVMQGNKVVVLKPGQQAINGNNELIVKIADTEMAIAWKNGLFKFDNADVPTLMRQLSRWYNVDVVYEGVPSSRRFSGKIYRNVNALTIADILSYKKIHFRIEGQRIIVMP
jgi:transmembrane sensor